MAARRKPQEIQVVEKQLDLPAAAPSGEGAMVLAMIDKLAQRPDVPIDKIQEMIKMHLGLKAEQAKSAYFGAFAEMQPNLPHVMMRGAIKNKYGQVQSKYALWEDVVDAISPVLARYGFALSFRTQQPEGRLRVTGILAHRDGHSEETTLELPLDSSGSKNAVQAVGSSVSYGKRYTAFALLNLSTRGEDDDGQSAVRRPGISEEDAGDLFDLIAESGANIDKFFQAANLEPLGEDRSIDVIKERLTGINPANFKTLKSLLERKRGQ